MFNGILEDIEIYKRGIPVTVSPEATHLPSVTQGFGRADIDGDELCHHISECISTINKQFHGDVMGRNGYVLSTGTHRMGNHQWQTPCGFVTQGFTSNMKPHLGGEKGGLKSLSF
jgi:hypothetical protein